MSRIRIVSLLAAGTFFAAAGFVALAADTLQQKIAGRDWSIAWVAGADAPATAQGQLRFEDTGKISGSGGCNRLRGDYGVAESGDGFSVKDVARTRRLCSGEIMQFEGAILEALKTADKVRVGDDGMLTLFNADAPLLKLK